MTKITPEKTGPDTADLIYKAYKDHADKHNVGEKSWKRNHLGASILGHECERYLWLSFRWAQEPDHDGRLLRLFERGQREEAWIIRDLRRAGFTVTSKDPETGKQFRIKNAGHVGGSVDGLIEGVPEAPKTVHVLEIKTSNRKQFEKLKQKKVRSAKPLHFVQMQLYMDGMGLDRALYVCICKDTDEIYTQRVKLDPKFVEKKKARARSIIDAAEPPAKKSSFLYPPCTLTAKDGTEYLCDYFELCHGQRMPERNCRTCVESTPTTDDQGKPVWTCGLHPDRSGLRRQRKGCSSQLSIPSIINAKVAEIEEGVERRITYQFDDGTLKTETGGER